MGILDKPKHELFAQHLAQGETGQDAYEKAGFRRHTSNWILLKNRPEIKARVAELLGDGAEMAAVTIADIARQLDEDRDLAWEKGNAAAAVAASLGKAKVLGLIIDRQGGPDGGPQQVVHKLDLSNLTPEQMAALASIRIAGE